MERSTSKIVIELEGLSPSKSQMEAIGKAVQAAAVQSLPLSDGDGLLVRPSIYLQGDSTLLLRLANVLDGGSM